MRRVVVTGIGIISCIGNNQEEVAESLKAGRSGITKDERQTELGFRSCISGRPTLNPKEHVEKRSFRFMGEAAGWAAVSLQEAIDDAGLDAETISHPRTGIIAGSGGPSAIEIVRAADIVREKGSPKRIGPFAVPKAMRLKFVPKIIFKLDNEYYKSKRIEKIFDDINAEDVPSKDGDQE